MVLCGANDMREGSAKGSGAPEREHGKENLGSSALGLVLWIDDSKKAEHGVLVWQIVCNLLGDGHDVGGDAL